MQDIYRARKAETIVRSELEVLMNSREQAHCDLRGYYGDAEDDDESMESDSDREMDAIDEDNEPVEDRNAGDPTVTTGLRCWGPSGTDLF